MADIKQKYAAAATITIGVASLATSSSKLAGRESNSVDNTTNLYDDCLVSGKITVGTSPTANKSVEVWVYSNTSDTPTYPDVFDGTDSAETVTSDGVKFGCLKLLKTFTTESTSDRAYEFANESVAALFGFVPKFWGLFVTHDTGVNLNSTSGNHSFSYVGCQYQSV